MAEGRQSLARRSSRDKEAIQQALRLFSDSGQTCGKPGVPIRVVGMGGSPCSGRPAALSHHCTALLSGLVSSGSIPFSAAVTSALEFGSRWDQTMAGIAESNRTAETGWSRFEEIRRLIEGRAVTALAVPRSDLPQVGAPSKPFWYS